MIKDTELAVLLYRCGIRLLFDMHSQIRANTFTKEELKAAFIKSGFTVEDFDKVFPDVAYLFCKHLKNGELVCFSFNGHPEHIEIF